MIFANQWYEVDKIKLAVYLVFSPNEWMMFDRNTGNPGSPMDVKVKKKR